MLNHFHVNVRIAMKLEAASFFTLPSGFICFYIATFVLWDKPVKKTCMTYLLVIPMLWVGCKCLEISGQGKNLIQKRIWGGRGVEIVEDILSWSLLSALLRYSLDREIILGLYFDEFWQIYIYTYATTTTMKILNIFITLESSSALSQSTSHFSLPHSTPLL